MTIRELLNPPSIFLVSLTNCQPLGQGTGHDCVIMADEFYYRERLIDHYKHPRRKGLLATPDARSHDHNPFCGDEVTIDLTFAQGTVTDAAFDGRGCSICLATASILVDEVVGKATADLATWDQQTVLDLLGIEIGPVRMKCALLPLNVLQRALREHQSPPRDE